MGKMGLTLRGDPPRTIDMTGREWGTPIDGLVLSIRQIPKEDSTDRIAISVVMKNVGDVFRTISVPGWLFFHEIEIDAPLTAWGREALKPERKTAPSSLTMFPGDATETELPIGSLYALRRGGSYRVCVCTKLGENLVLRSNEIEIH